MRFIIGLKLVGLKPFHPKQGALWSTGSCNLEIPLFCIYLSQISKGQDFVFATSQFLDAKTAVFILFSDDIQERKLP